MPNYEEDKEIQQDPMNPEEDQPSELDPLTHAEFITQYEDAGKNIRFAKLHQWRMVITFTVGAFALVAYGEATSWRDSELLRFLLYMLWAASIANVFIICSLQWWQANEQDKIKYLKSKWSSFTQAASLRKSSLVGDIHRYGMLAIMILYIEMVMFGVTKVYWVFI